MHSFLQALLLLSLFASSANAANGRVLFSNRTPAFGIDAPVTLNTTGEGPGPAYSAALYLVTPSGLTLVPDSVTRFRDPSENKNPAVSRYIVPKTVDIPGTAPGQRVTLRMRVWLSSEGSYEKAKPASRAESADIIIPAIGGGAGFPSNMPKTLAGFVIQDGPRKSVPSGR